MADDRYVADAETVLIIKRNGVFSALGHPSLPLSACNDERCRGFRFQARNYGPCRQSKTCAFVWHFTGVELLRAAPRFVRRCAVCERIYIGGGGKTAQNAQTCHSEACATRWAEDHPSVDNRCEACGQICFAECVVPSGILLDHYPIVFAGRSARACLDPAKGCRGALIRCGEAAVLNDAQGYLASPTVPEYVKRAIRDRYGGRLAESREIRDA